MKRWMSRKEKRHYQRWSASVENRWSMNRKERKKVLRTILERSGHKPARRISPNAAQIAAIHRVLKAEWDAKA